jgi:hypothetical protein
MIGLAISLMIQALVIAVRLMLLVLRLTIELAVAFVVWASRELEARGAR